MATDLQARAQKNAYRRSSMWVYRTLRGAIRIFLFRYLRVRHRGAEHLNIERLESLDLIRECNDFGRAHEGKVQRIEEQNDISAAIIGKSNRLERSVRHNRLRLKVWR